MTPDDMARELSAAMSDGDLMCQECGEHFDRQAEPLCRECMVRELRAAGWSERVGGLWLRPRGARFSWNDPLLAMEEAWKELAQQRERGTVTTPVVGAEDARHD